MQSSEEESESIATFCAITNTEPDLAQRFLSLADGQLDNAVALFMEHGAGLVGSGAGSSGANAGGDNDINESTGMDEIIRQDAEDSYRPVIAPRHDTLVGGPMYSMYDEDIFEDAAFAAAASTSSSSSMSSLPIPLGSHRHASSEGAFSASGGASSSAQQDSKANKLARMFATPYEIMFEGSFDAARQEARDASKWILVTVSDRTEFACEAQKRDLWNSPLMREFISASFVFLFYPSDSPDGMRHASFYRVDGLPYFAILDPRTGESMKVWTTTPKKEVLLQEFATFLDLNSLDNFRAPKPKRKASQSVGELTEEEQLNLAIAASLGGGSSGAQQVMDLTGDDDEDDVEVAIIDEWASILSIASPEPAQSADVTRLQFKLPDGTRLVRKFSKTQAVRDLFAYVKSCLKEKEILDKFELLNFRDGLYAKLNQTLEEAKVLNSSITVELKE
ncbi:hypothetical protein BJ741DRAFT_632016 [Chytriomyces cf. hyalinus JEL632]|nr:hypothetical protein BJ741DRAFT_632016 [Chytriomyces cf. hyalinus JEL632]